MTIRIPYIALGGERYRIVQRFPDEPRLTYRHLVRLVAMEWAFKEGWYWGRFWAVARQGWSVTL
jgi:hypothetical protein